MFVNSEEISSAAYKLAKILTDKKAASEEILKFTKIASLLGDSRASRLLNFEQAKKTNARKGLVRQIQSNLNRLGFDAGAVDGLFGKKTFDALRAYECIYQLPLSGVPTNEISQSIIATKKGRLSQEALKEVFFD